MPSIPKKRLSSLLHGSLFLKWFRRFVQYIYTMASKSAIGTALSSYQVERCQMEPRLFSHLLHGKRLNIKNQIVLPWMRLCNKSIAQSRILRWIRQAMRWLFDLPVRFIGIILVTFGVTTAVLSFLSEYGFSLHNLTQREILIHYLIALLAIPLLFLRKPISEAFGGSAVVRFILCTAFGYSKQIFTPISRPTGRTGTALLIGMTLSLLTIKWHILQIATVIVLFILAHMIILSPETGVLLILALIPFLSTLRLAVLIIFTVCSFGLKVLQGKRSLSFELMDYAIGGFALLLLVGGFVSFSKQASIRSALLMFCFVCTYFLIINTVCTSANVKRCIGVVLFSACTEGVIGVLEWFFGALSTRWQDMSLFSEINGRIVGTFANPNVLGEFFLLTIPFLFAILAIAGSSAKKICVLVLIGITGASLVFTWSRGAWIGILLGLLVFGILTSQKNFMLFTVLGISLPLLTSALPVTLLSRFTSITNLSDSSTAYRLNIWKGCLSMAKEYLWCGIGTGIDTFQTVYPHFALEGIDTAPHSHSLYMEILIEHGLLGLLLFLLIIFLFVQSVFSYLRHSNKQTAMTMRLFSCAGLCAVLAFLIHGFTDYVWYNYRVFCLFWMILALTSSCRRAAVSEQTFLIADDLYANSYGKEHLS